jgi:thiol-disulfide isomerase/thioredoxin
VLRVSRRRFAALLAVALVLAAAPAAAAPAAPGFRVTLLDSGRTFDSRDAMGKRVVVLRFQASYCQPCVRESAALSRVTERYAGRGVDVLALHVQDTAADVRRFMRAEKPGYAIALDPRLVVGNRFHVKGTPYTVVINKKGEVVARLAGEGAPQRLPRILDDALSSPRKR